MRARRIVGVGLAAAGLLSSAQRARSLTVSPTEERVFRTFNDAPDALAPLTWPVMQMGSLASVFVAAAHGRRRSGNQTPSRSPRSARRSGAGSS